MCSKWNERHFHEMVMPILLVVAISAAKCACQESRQQPAAAARRIALDRENFDQLLPLIQKRAGGEPESFSMEATGLGDLEEADALRKMLRRRPGERARRPAGHHRRPCSPEAAGAPARAVVRRADEARQRPASRLFAGAGLAAREQMSEGQDEGQDELALDDTMGEFGSRLSLLTTRKVQPDEILIDDSTIDIEGGAAPARQAEPSITATNNELRLSIDVQEADDQAMAGSQRRAPLAWREQAPARPASSSNYLPRFARASFM